MYFRRSIEKFSSVHLTAAQSVDPDHDGGELLITISPELAAEHIILDKFFNITVEYSIEEPVGGLHFVIPECEGSYAEVCTRILLGPNYCRKELKKEGTVILSCIYFTNFFPPE